MTQEIDIVPTSKMEKPKSLAMKRRTRLSHRLKFSSCQNHVLPDEPGQSQTSYLRRNQAVNDLKRGRLFWNRGNWPSLQLFYLPQRKGKGKKKKKKCPPHKRVENMLVKKKIIMFHALFPPTRDI